jgi:GGDEF domain-containing protein
MEGTMLTKEKILIPNFPDPNLEDLLRGMDYHLVPVHSVEEMIHCALREDPSLIIGDFSHWGNLWDPCERVKNHLMVRHIPFIVLSDKDDTHDKIKACESGATDYVVKPFLKEELSARIKRSIKDMRGALNANPLTRLPGNLAIQENLEKILLDKKPLAIAYLDIDHFKSYNDLYGYTAGDKVISFTSNLLLECRDHYGTENDIFVGHIGGDDFLVIASESLIESFCLNYIAKFDAMAPFHYDEKTRKQGVILGCDRKGQSMTFPFISISIAIVINENGDKFKHIGEIATAGAEVKKYLKKFSGSCYLIDRRISLGKS